VIDLEEERDEEKRRLRRAPRIERMKKEFGDLKI